jgi:hypothetical protein
LTTREIDRDVEGVAPSVPDRHLCTGLAHHPAADFTNAAGTEDWALRNLNPPTCPL